MRETGGLRQLFEELLELDGAEREARLAACEPAEREKLDAMLAAEEAFTRSASEDETTRTYPWPGDSIGAYRLLAPIGDGGMGSVWLAESRSAPEVTVAIKFAAAKRVDADEARARLEQERRILARLEHPGIVPVVDAGEAETQGPFLVMPLVDGVPLQTHLKTLARGDRAGLARVIGALAEALDHVHERGFVHRDVKPSNVLVRPDGTVVLVDFGVARALDQDALTSAYVTQGVAPHTPAFASPEQERGTEVTPRTDVFALGKVLEAAREALGLTGDRTLDAIVARATDADEAKRHRSAGEFGGALDAWARPAAPRRPRALVFAAAALGVLFAGLVGFSIGEQAPGGPPPGTGSDDARDALTELLEEVPAADLQGGEELYLQLAAERPEDGWGIAAGFAALRHDDRASARDHALEGAEQLDALSPRRLADLGDLAAELGLLGTASEAYTTVATHAPDVETEWLYHARALMTRARAGEPLTDGTFAVLEPLRGELAAALDAEEDELNAPELGELDPHDPPGAYLLAALAAGVPGAVEHWAEEVDPESWREPGEAPPALTEALLLLHARLVASGELESLDVETLTELDVQLLELHRDEDEDSSLRAWGLARALRVVALLDVDAHDAEALASEAVALLMARGESPSDLLVTLDVLRAHALLEIGEHAPAEEAAEAALGRARFECGDTVADRLEDWRGDARPLIAGVLAEGQASRVLAVLGEHEEDRRRACWWAR